LQSVRRKDIRLFISIYQPLNRERWVAWKVCNWERVQVVYYQG